MHTRLVAMILALAAFAAPASRGVYAQTGASAAGASAAGASAAGASAAAGIEVASRITEVTVYSDRAMVTRRADVRLPAGESTLVFGNLPAATDAASLQVRGLGAFTLRDVRIVRRQLTRDLSAQLKALEDEKRGIEDSINLENDRIRVAEAERAFLLDMAKRLTSGAGESESPPLDTAAWARMLDFYRGRNEAVNETLRVARRAVQKFQAELDRVNREIRDTGPGSRLSLVEAEVVVEAKTALQARVDISYIVPGPSWRPDYVIRADSEGSRLSLQYRATLRQNTGEDWSEAALSLSTAQPQVGGVLPVLSPWRLDIYKPEPVYREFSRSQKLAAPPSPQVAPSADLMAAEAAPEPAMAMLESSVSSGASAVLFGIPGASTVASDNRDRTVTIAVLDLPVSFSYAAGPKLSPYAYFRAVATNDSDYPFLGGATHVYVDGAYVADGFMEQVAPGGVFRTDLGVDESVRVERKLKKKFDESTGLVTKKQKTSWEYQIVVKNGKRQPIVLSVSDQLPISGNEQIVVKLIEPVYTKDSDTLRKGEFETLVWSLNLAPGRELSLPLSFSVEYPKGVTITGLE